MQSIYIAIGVMVGCGIFGGLVNYCLALRETQSSERWRLTEVVTSIIVGIAASLLVPLFLEMISSDLVQDAAKSELDWLVFGGLCLLAAISSTAFIRTLSDRVLKEATAARKEAQEAHKQVQEVQESVEPIIAKETEDDPMPSADHPFSQDGNGDIFSLPKISDEGRIVLKKMSSSSKAYRSISGLHDDTGLSKSKVNKTLTELVGENLVGTRIGSKGPRWYITENGRRAVWQLESLDKLNSNQ